LVETHQESIKMRLYTRIHDCPDVHPEVGWCEEVLEGNTPMGRRENFDGIEQQFGLTVLEEVMFTAGGGSDCCFREAAMFG
jgi:hypothetical protein